MLIPRVIPSLLLSSNGLVKTIKFKNPVYLGDPINIIKIFNDKEVDELVLLDINASVEGVEPNFKLLSEICSECFMPLAYGGGIKTVEQMEKLFRLGFEKVIVNSEAGRNPSIVRMAAARFGCQSVVVSIDVSRRVFGGYGVFLKGSREKTSYDLVQYAIKMQEYGAGELLLTSIDRDGTMQGFDLNLIRNVTAAVDIPVVACGGAGKLEDFRLAVHEAGASAVAAGSYFVFQGPHRAVLVTFPERRELKELFINQ